MLQVQAPSHRLDRPLPLFEQQPLRAYGQQAPRTITLNGILTHPSHRLAFYRGLYICIRCGHMAHTEVHKLRKVCEAPRATGTANLKRMRQDKPPYHIKKKYNGWPEVEKQAVPQSILIPILTRSQLKTQIPPPGTRPTIARPPQESPIWGTTLGFDDSD